MSHELGANLEQTGPSSRRNSFTEIVSKMHVSFNNLTQNNQNTIEIPVATLVENKDGLGGATYDLTYRKVTVKGYCRSPFSFVFCS